LSYGLLPYLAGLTNPGD